jgi:hypothetical protein
MVTDEEIRQEAVERLKERRGFYMHLGVYVIVNAILFFTWLISTPGAYYWPVWTTLGWGIGISFHGFSVLVGKNEPSESRIAREVDRMRGGASGHAPSA